MIMWIENRCGLVVDGCSRTLQTTINQQRSTNPKTWHFRHDWSFTPFVVVVGGKYFLPVPECLLFDRA